LAVGFASQSLIKDVINGLFILFEDSLSVGDVVKVRNISGQVEKFTLRAVTLRDVSGSVHVIPNSAIDTVTNTTKDYSRYVLDIGVAYGEEIGRAVALLKDIGDELRRDPQYGRDILEPVEVMGVERFTESAVVLRIRLKTRAMQQWRIGREFNRRVKDVFGEQGMEVPLPQRPLQWGNPVAGN
jgi:small conductance mechanosensitive channel